MLPVVPALPSPVVTTRAWIAFEIPSEEAFLAQQPTILAQLAALLGLASAAELTVHKIQKINPVFVWLELPSTSVERLLSLMSSGQLAHIRVTAVIPSESSDPPVEQYRQLLLTYVPGIGDSGSSPAGGPTSALLEACRQHQVQAVKELLQRGADPNPPVDPQRDYKRASPSNPLQLAVEYVWEGQRECNTDDMEHHPSVELLDALLAAGARPSEPSLDPTINYACRLGILPAVQRLAPLVHDAAVLLRAAQDTLSSPAGSESGLKCLSALLDLRPSLLNAQDDKGRTLLHTAAASGHDKAIRLLLKRSANPTLLNSEGNTALHLAVMKYPTRPYPHGFNQLDLEGHKRIIKALVKAGPSAVNQKNERQQTPRQLAETRDCADLIDEVTDSAMGASRSSGMSAATLEQRLELLGINQRIDVLLVRESLASAVQLLELPASTSSWSAALPVLNQRGIYNDSNVLLVKRVLETLGMEAGVLDRLQRYHDKYCAQRVVSPASSPATYSFTAGTVVGPQGIFSGPVTFHGSSDRPPVASPAGDERERRFLRLSEAWIAHYEVAHRLDDLSSKWNSYSDQAPLPYFGTGRDGARRAHAHFIEQRTLIRPLFALLARFEQLRPNGLSQAEAQSLG